MARKSKSKQSSNQGYLTQKLNDFSGGLNTDNPTTIAPNDLAVANDVVYTQEGRVTSRPSTSQRFANNFDTNPVIGMAPFYKSDGTTRLVMAAGTTLYADNPHIVFDYDSQNSWQQNGVYTDLNTIVSPGDVTMNEILQDGFEDGTFGRWTSADPGWSIDTTVYNSGTRSAKGTGTAQKLTYDFRQSQTNVYVKVAARFNETNYRHFPVIFISPSGTQIQAVIADGDGNFKYFNGSALTLFPISTTYTTGTWYTIEVWFSNGTFWVSINGNSVTPNGLSAKDTSNNAQTQVNKYVAQTHDTATSTLWIDNAYICPISAVFSRSSVAYDNFGNQLGNNVPRYQYMALPYPEFQDNFTTNDISNYTSGGDTAATWTITPGSPNGTLTGTGGTRAALVVNNLIMQDCDIIITTTQMADGGIFARFQDNNNYYVVAIQDSGNGNAMQLNKRVGGTITPLAGASISFTRGTSHTIKFALHGSRLEVYFDGTKVIFITDTQFSSGSVGLRNNSTTSSIYTSFAVYYAQQGLMVEEGTTNLLTANQSHPTSTTGLGSWSLNGSQTLVIDSTTGWVGSSSAKVTNGYTAAQDCSIDLGNISISANTAYSFSVYFKASSNVVAYVEIDYLDSNKNPITWNGGTQITASTSFWQRAMVSATSPNNAAYAHIYLYIKSLPVNGSVWGDGFQFEQKSYPTSWITGGSSRAVETCTVPTAGVFTKGSWTVELVYIPMDTAVPSTNNQLMCWFLRIDANNWYQIYVNTSGQIVANLCSGGTVYGVSTSANFVSLGNVYSIMFAGNGSVIRLCVNGVQIGSDTTYTEPVGTLASSMYVGSLDNATWQGNGSISNFRISSRARTLAEHQAAYNSGLPLAWDIDTTYLLGCAGNLTLPSDRQGTWQSPPQNASNASDKSTLTVTWTDDVYTNSAVACQVRTSADGVNWSAWYSQVNGQTASAPVNTYSQIRFILQVIGNAKVPVLHKATAFYQGSPNAQVLRTGMSVTSFYSFAQLLDSLIIVNGADTPKQYDGTNISDITGAPVGKLCCVYKNRVFIANIPGNTSRIQYSALQSITDWSSYNNAGLIDVNPNDGDQITALVPTSMTLLIAKQHTSYFLQGYSPATFQVSTAGEGGTISPWGIIWTPYGVFRLDREGVWATDFRKQVLLTKKIQAVWDNLNQAQLTKAALYFYKDKLLVAVCSKNSNYNDTLMVYDLIQKAWSVWTGLTPAVFCDFWEQGNWVYLFGTSNAGNVVQFVDNTGNVNFQMETAHIDLGGENILKRVKWVDVCLGNNSNTSITANIYCVADEVNTRNKVATIPANTKLFPVRLFNVAYAKTLGVGVIATNIPPNSLLVESVMPAFYPRAARPQRLV